LDDVSEFLGLSAEESAALKAAVANDRKSFDAAVAAHATVERIGTQILIHLREEPDVRTAYNHYLDSVAAILGPERYGYFESLGAKATLEKLFQGWGLVASTVTITPGARAAAVRGLMSVMHDFGVRGVKNYGYNVESREELRKNIGGLEALIPADVIMK
jgi:hypothetical protein